MYPAMSPYTVPPSHHPGYTTLTDGQYRYRRHSRMDQYPEVKCVVGLNKACSSQWNDE